MRFLLEKSLEHLESAGRERTSHNYREARRQYLAAAECLFQASAQSSGRLRDIRVRKAEQLVDIARRLEGASRLDGQRRAEAIGAESVETSFLLREPSDVRFADVAGLEDAKEEIRLRLIYPLAHPEKAKRYGIESGGGVLLYGPPGTGKTLLARAIAGELDAPCFTARPSELMSKWVGEAEQNVARLFDEARACERAVVFLDEVEAMLPAGRSSGSTVMQRVVPQFLAELQGMRRRSRGLLFLGATNEPWGLDPAVLRPGRFDARIYVGLPDQAARRRMLELHLSKRPLDRHVDLDQLAESLAGYSGADIAEICQRAAVRVFMEGIRDGTERDIAAEDVHSALVAGRPSVSAKELVRYEHWRVG
jgi:transitional endoplasmic reticulum ATPase